MSKGRSSLPAVVLRAMRPAQWTKNVFVFAALVFARRFDDPEALLQTGLVFVVFCLLSSAVYLINDIADREADRLHPEKRRRPIAAGDLSVGTAVAVAVALVVAAFAIALPLGWRLAAVACTYLLMNLAYSLSLKRVVILDVMLVAAGFLLRAWAGSVALGLEMSHWLVLCTGLIALFLGFVKRRQEIVSSERATEQRVALRDYSLPFLDQMISVTTASTLLAYSLYAFSDEVAERLGGRSMGLTIPFVLFGIFRYLYLVYQRGEGENPTALVLRDRALLLTVLLWGGTVLLVLHLSG